MSFFVQPLHQGCGDFFLDCPLPCLHWVIMELLSIPHFITCSLSFYYLFMSIFLPKSDTWFITHLCESSARKGNIVKRKDHRGKKLEIWALFWLCYKVCKWLGKVTPHLWSERVGPDGLLRPYKIYFTMWGHSRILFTCSPILVIVCLQQKRSFYVKCSTQNGTPPRGLLNNNWSSLFSSQG